MPGFGRTHSSTDVPKVNESADKLSLVSIVGFPHSGSTLLGDILASSTGTVHAGELALLFRMAARPGVASCSCRLSVDDCPVWGPAARTALDAAGVQATELDQMLQRVSAADPWQRSVTTPSELVAALQALVSSYMQTTGNHRIIDSSNWPGFAELLESAHPGRVATVHLVRSPVAAIASRYRRGVERMASDFGRARRAAMLGADIARWISWNHKVSQSDPVAAVQFEELCDDPHQALEAIAQQVEWEFKKAEGDAFDVVREHVFWGNRRATTGTVNVRLPTSPLPFGPISENMVRLATWPAARTYGYGYSDQ